MKPIDDLVSTHVPKIFVVCDRKETMPLWGYVLRQQGMIAILETSVEKAIDRWSTEMPELVVIDVDTARQDPIDICRRFRAVSLAPLLLLLPGYHETQILEAYEAGVDDVIIKPVTPAVFLSKLMAWLRRAWIMPTDGLNQVHVGHYRLIPVLRCLVDPNEVQIKLTNLEFRLLHLLMSRPGHVFKADEIIQSIWSGYGDGDQVLLKNVVYRLRRKIEADPSNPLILRTGPGGYSFQG